MRAAGIDIGTTTISGVARSRSYTPAQVRLIVAALGEP